MNLREVAQVLDELRVFPRVFLVCLSISYITLIWQCWDWYISLDLQDKEVSLITAYTAFPIALLAALGKMLKDVYELYTKGGSNGN